MGAALLAGYGIATYTTGSSNPITILDDSRIPTSKYATLKELEKVSIPPTIMVYSKY